MNKWIADLADLAERDEPSVLVTVASVRGSAPREVGAKMIVTANETIGTIGGGQLEYQCAQIACEQLKKGCVASARLFRRFVLGANCGQCCGGVVEMMFESTQASESVWQSQLPRLVESRDQRTSIVMATSTKEPGLKFLIAESSSGPFGECSGCPDPVVTAANKMLADNSEAQMVDDFLLEPVRPTALNIAVFGAGHVGAASVDVLARLDCNIRWVDNRRNIFPASLPDNVQAVESAEPAREALAMPPGSMFLVMTHSHPLDLDICARVLQQDDFAYCGLIGSVSKRRRFERLMKNQGLSGRQLEQLVCPIGVAGVGGRKPTEIAIAVAAEVLQVRDATNKNMTDVEADADKIQAI